MSDLPPDRVLLIEVQDGAEADIRQEKRLLGQSPTGRTPVLVGARQEGDQQ